jgi:hypothetical protein
MKKPIDLIIANVMHECAGQQTAVDAIIEAALAVNQNVAHRDNGAAVTESSMRRSWLEECARKLLCTIAHDGKIGDVFKALATLNAPSTPEMIGEGLQAVKDRQ